MVTNDCDVIDAEFAEVRGLGEVPEPGRALVVIGSRPRPAAAAVAYSFRPDSSFVAHLIAAAANAPQTRKLRRASPDAALASYRSSAARQQNDPTPTGKTTSRVA
jgi:hypothetical protein